MAQFSLQSMAAHCPVEPASALALGPQVNISAGTTPVLHEEGTDTRATSNAILEW